MYPDLTFSYDSPVTFSLRFSEPGSGLYGEQLEAYILRRRVEVRVLMFYVIW